MWNKRNALRAAATVLVITMSALLSGCSSKMLVMDPRGPIGESQKDLILISSTLCGIILVPVLILTAYIVWRYRDKKNSKAAYEPNWSHSTAMETVWWGIPIVVIAVLAVITARYTYALEPSKPIESEQKAITIQATSLDWKWLFTYPEQGIASVNVLEIPAGVPVKFEVSSDGAMNSFWIPQLGGQVYAMNGMAMTLYLQADQEGVYYGSGANFTGEHFADMKFNVNAVSQEKFDKWVDEVKRTSPAMSEASYTKLAEPGKASVQLFSSYPEGLFQRIVTQYVGSNGHHMEGMDMKDMKDMKDMNMDGMDHSSPDQMHDHAAE